mmetsp:Transcript_56519/g.103776  ORF Transcript_56519/g.103776 Transcript_56519/m.103776 type:complete len:539 (-) Transcript_56519:31-1647(-)
MPTLGGNAPVLKHQGSLKDQVKYAEKVLETRSKSQFQMESLRSGVGSKSKLAEQLGVELSTDQIDEDDVAMIAIRELSEAQNHQNRGLCAPCKKCYAKWKMLLNIKKKRHKQQVKDGIGHPFPWARRMVLTQTFEVCLSLLIIANCFFIGWQAEQFDPDDTTEMIITIFEQFFTFGFFVELVLRIFCYNWTFFFDSENWLDIFLVLTSVLTTWILGPAQVKADFMRKLTLLRVLRLTRLARQVKHRSEFKEMWMLIRGLGDSMETLFWTYVMIGCVLYFFAIMATSLMTRLSAFEEPQSAKELTEENFGTVPESMFTLFQVMTLDSWTGLMRPLMDVHGWVVVFFVVFISVAEFMLMNLVTAVIVKNAFERSKEDKADLAAELEAQKEKDLQDLQIFFDDLDADKSGSLTRSELVEAYKLRKIRNKFQTLDIGRKDLDTLWEALDDGDGELTIEEFVSGMRKLKGEARAKDMLRLYKEVRFLESSIREIYELSELGMSKMTNIKMKLGATFRELDATRRTLRRMKEAAKLAVKAQPFH